MNVKLLTSSRSFQDMKNFAALAALTCHDNIDKMNSKGYKPSDVLKNIINAGHESILEHINLTFSVKGLSRACLQELARHRHISLSVESTRFTLRKFFDKGLFISNINEFSRDFSIGELGLCSFKQFVCNVLGSLITIHDMPNDELKYYLPEFWPTNLIITLNIREFRHILKLRTAPTALKEFRVLARSMFPEVPDEFKYLLQDCVHEEG